MHVKEWDITLKLTHLNALQPTDRARNLYDAATRPDSDHRVRSPGPSGCSLSDSLRSVLNNDGYVIERKIHGENAAYNEIASWRWQEMLHFFGAKDGSTASYRVKNRKELEALFGNAEFAKADKIQ